MSLRDVGWLWEGQGFNLGTPPSIYGLGQGASYFGFRNVCFMFHECDEHAMHLLNDVDQVVCDVTKWRFNCKDDGWTKLQPQCNPVAMRAEIEKLAILANRFDNITGAIFDDAYGLMTEQNFTPAQFGEVRAAMRDLAPRLKQWIITYTHELEHREYWQEMSPYVDIVNLWVWESETLDTLMTNIDGCRALMPEKPIIMGVYMHDYPNRRALPVERVKWQMEQVAELLNRGIIAGFSVIGSVLIDIDRKQADIIRDYVART